MKERLNFKLFKKINFEIERRSSFFLNENLNLKITLRRSLLKRLNNFEDIEEADKIEEVEKISKRLNNFEEAEKYEGF